jgi:hypothetical protein
MINLNPIRDRLAGPFVPFVIHLSDGRKFEVPHRDFIAVGKGVVVIVDRNDSTHTVDSLHIVSIADAAPKHGRKSKPI